MGMRTIEQPIPFVEQGSRPWCWAACCAMAIGYFTPAKYAPSRGEIVEFVKAQPKGSCAADPPVGTLQGDHLHMMRLAIAQLARRKTTTVPPISAPDLHASMERGDVVILGVPGHVMVASGLRFPRATFAAAELRINDPALASPYWTHFANVKHALTDCIVVHVSEYV